jgi:phospholipid/cholesterol/gamma-HCH transport system substrate-binding protein
VGAFVLGLLGVFVAGVLWIASGGNGHQKITLYQAIETESVSGLNVDAPVKYNGVDVGTVKSIDLDPANPQRVRLLFALRHGTPVKLDTLAVLKTQGLTGIAYVELSGGSPASPLLLQSAPGVPPTIATRPSLSARLENVLGSVLTKLDATTTHIDALLSAENLGAVRSALADISAVTHTVAARKGTIDAGIVNAGRTFDNSAQLSAELRPVVDRIGQAASAVQTMAGDAGQASTQAGGAVAAVGGEVRRFSAQTLPEMRHLLTELNLLSASLRRLTEQAERGSGGLLLGRVAVPEGPGEIAPKAPPP